MSEFDPSVEARLYDISTPEEQGIPLLPRDFISLFVVGLCLPGLLLLTGWLLA